MTNIFIIGVLQVLHELSSRLGREVITTLLRIVIVEECLLALILVIEDT